MDEIKDKIHRFSAYMPLRRGQRVRSGKSDIGQPADINIVHHRSYLFYLGGAKPHKSAINYILPRFFTAGLGFPRVLHGENNLQSFRAISRTPIIYHMK